MTAGNYSKTIIITVNVIANYPNMNSQVTVLLEYIDFQVMKTIMGVLNQLIHLTEHLELFLLDNRFYCTNYEIKTDFVATCNCISKY